MTKDSTTLTEIPGYTFVNPRSTRDALGREIKHVYPLSERQVAALMTYIDVQITYATTLAAPAFTQEQLDRNKREVIAILTGEAI